RPRSDVPGGVVNWSVNTSGVVSCAAVRRVESLPGSWDVMILSLGLVFTSRAEPPAKRQAPQPAKDAAIVDLSHRVADAVGIHARRAGEPEARGVQQGPSCLTP